jgi:hypothetical protein
MRKKYNILNEYLFGSLHPSFLVRFSWRLSLTLFWWYWTLHLLGKHSTIWAMPPILFTLAYFLGRVLRFSLGASFRPWSSYLYLPSIWDYRNVPPCPVCFLKQGLTTFFAWAGLEPRSSHLHLLCSWNYTCTLPCPTILNNLNSMSFRF